MQSTHRENLLLPTPLIYFQIRALCFSSGSLTIVTMLLINDYQSQKDSMVKVLKTGFYSNGFDIILLIEIFYNSNM